MSAARLTSMVLLGGVLLAGCSPPHEIARARAELAAARAQAAQAELMRIRAEAEAARVTRPAKAPDGLRVWRDTETEELCKWLGFEAVCYKYEGGWAACWIDIEIDGKSVRWGEDEGIHKAATEATLAGPAIAKPSGGFVWLRRLEDKQEVWELAFKCSVKTAGGALKKALEQPAANNEDKVVAEKTSSNAESSSRIILRAPNGPPQPPTVGKQRLVQGQAEILLKEGQSATLVTLYTEGEKDGQVSRTVKLQCKAIK